MQLSLYSEYLLYLKETGLSDYMQNHLSLFMRSLVSILWNVRFESSGETRENLGECWSRKIKFI